MRSQICGMMLCFLGAESLHASEQHSVVVSNVSGTVYNAPTIFLAPGPRTTKPSCATDDYWAIPTNYTVENARNIVSLALTSYTTGRKITIVGSGTCNAVFTTREDVSYVVNE